MKRALLPFAVVGSVLALTVGVASAGANQGDTQKGIRLTLFNCSPGQATYDVIAGNGIGIGGLSVVGSNMQYVILTQSWTDADGAFHSVSIGKATANRQLVTCHYIGPISGTDYTNVGFFTPVGPQGDER